MKRLREHWLTGLSVLFVVFLIVGGVEGDLVLGSLGVALLIGLWLLRKDRGTPAAYILIVVPLVLAGLELSWVLFIPTILALVVIVFGVIRGGLARELRPA